MVLSISVKNLIIMIVMIINYLYEYMRDFEKFKEELPNKDKFYSVLTDRKINEKLYKHVSNV